MCRTSAGGGSARAVATRADDGGPGAEHLLGAQGGSAQPGVVSILGHGGEPEALGCREPAVVSGHSAQQASAGVGERGTVGLRFPHREQHRSGVEDQVSQGKAHAGERVRVAVAPGRGEEICVLRPAVPQPSVPLQRLPHFNVFLDPRIEPFNDDVVVLKNTIRENGANPDPLRTFTPGADIVFLPDVFDPGPITGTPGTLLLVDPDPSDNCFEANKFDVDFRPGVVDAFPCP